MAKIPYCKWALRHPWTWLHMVRNQPRRPAPRPFAPKGPLALSIRDRERAISDAVDFALRALEGRLADSVPGWFPAEGPQRDALVAEARGALYDRLTP